MMRRATAILLASVVIVLLFSMPFQSGIGDRPQSPSFPSSDNRLLNTDNYLTLNAPLLLVQQSSGDEIPLAHKTDYESYFFGAEEFALVGLTNPEIGLVGKIKAAGSDTNIDITQDRRHATLKNGETVYYGVRIMPVAQERVTGVTFVLSTVSKSGIPDIVNNSFSIKYVESVGGRAGDVREDSTSGKAYQVISPNGDIWYYFAFTAIARTGGIETTIVPHFFGGPYITSVEPKYVQCCCAHTKKCLPKVPEPRICWWYGIPFIDFCWLSWFKSVLYQTVICNTANVPCTEPEATGKELTIKGNGLASLNELTPDQIKITDSQGEVARVTEITSIDDTTIKAKFDITACRPGTKNVKVDGVGGFATLNFIKIVQDVPDTIVGQKRPTAVQIFGIQEKLPLTFTINNGENITFAPAVYQMYNVTCVTRVSNTVATATSTGGCNNIATTIIQGTCTPGEDEITVSFPGGACTAPIRNTDITLTTDIDGKNGIEPNAPSGDEQIVNGTEVELDPGAFLCVDKTKEVQLKVSSPSTHYSKVMLSLQSASTVPIIQVLDNEGVEITFVNGTKDVFEGKGSADITKTFTVKGVNPGTACLTATYYDACCNKKCDTIKFTVMKLLTLTATSSTGKTVTSDSGSYAPVLYLCEDADGNAKLTLMATTDPMTAVEQNRVLYWIDGKTATLPSGKIPLEGTKDITLNTGSENRKFTIYAGLDCNGDGDRDSDEPATRTVYAVVGKMNTLTVTEKANPDNFVIDDSPLGSNPVLHLALANQAEITVAATVFPLNDEGMMGQAMYKVTASDGQIVAEERFDSGKTTVALVPTSANTTFTVTAGLDCNGSGHLEPDEGRRSIEVALQDKSTCEIIIELKGDGNHGEVIVSEAYGDRQKELQKFFDDKIKEGELKTAGERLAILPSTSISLSHDGAAGGVGSAFAKTLSLTGNSIWSTELLSTSRESKDSKVKVTYKHKGCPQPPDSKTVIVMLTISNTKAETIDPTKGEGELIKDLKEWSKELTDKVPGFNKFIELLGGDPSTNSIFVKTDIEILQRLKASDQAESRSEAASSATFVRIEGKDREPAGKEEKYRDQLNGTIITGASADVAIRGFTKNEVEAEDAGIGRVEGEGVWAVVVFGTCTCDEVTFELTPYFRYMGRQYRKFVEGGVADKDLADKMNAYKEELLNGAELPSHEEIRKKLMEILKKWANTSFPNNFKD